MSGVRDLTVEASIKSRRLIEGDDRVRGSTKATWEKKKPRPGKKQEDGVD